MEQAKTPETLSMQSVVIGKNTAAFIVPDMNDGQKLAVIDEGVLDFLITLLPTANTWDIISRFIEKMEDIRNSPCTIEAAVEATKHFTAFHTTVNLAKKYFDPKVVVTMEKPFNQTPEAMTIREMLEKSKEWDVLITQHPDYEAYMNSLDAESRSMMERQMPEPEVVYEKGPKRPH